MKTVIFFAATLAVAMAIHAPDVTNAPLPDIPCSNSMCNSKPDGNHYYYHGGAYKYNYFLQCSGGFASCQPCYPLTLQFSEKCNQCLYKKDDDCVTTKPWIPATTFACPDNCPEYGPKFDGNVADYSNARQYVACWQGVTVGCIACPGNLMFNVKENACLYEGKYITEPIKK